MPQIIFSRKFEYFLLLNNHLLMVASRLPGPTQTPGGKSAAVTLTKPWQRENQTGVESQIEAPRRRSSGDDSSITSEGSSALDVSAIK